MRCVRAGFVVAPLFALVALAAAACSPADAGPVTFTFDEDVSKEQRQEVEAAVEATGRWLDSMGVEMPRVRLFGYRSLDALMAELDHRLVLTPDDVVELDSLFDGSGAVSLGTMVFINLNSEWRRLSPGERRHIISHEVFHVVQYHLAAADSGRALNEIPGADWLVEGAAEAAAVRVGLAEGSDANALRQPYFEALALFEGQRLGDVGDELAPYVLGFLALERLLAGRPDRDLIALSLAIVEAPEWEDGFANWGGKPVAEFIDEFERDRAAGLIQP